MLCQYTNVLQLCGYVCSKESPETQLCWQAKAEWRLLQEGRPSAAASHALEDLHAALK